MKKVLRKLRVFTGRLNSSVFLESLVTWGFRLYAVWEILRLLFKR
jgi:hypothetical protein